MALRNIPPIQCLVTFELLARLRSASRTAEELCVTVSAVSHRIRQLEAHLGFKLFASPGRPKMQSTPLGGSGPREAGELGGPVASPGRPKMQSAPLGGSGPREAGELGG
ncbi:MAG: LysR family transcriptional regulator, partial [Comamonadaceae bacterium]